MKPTMLKTHDPRRNEVLGLVRRRVSAGTFTKDEVAAWKKELASDVVDGIIKEFAPKAAKAAQSKKADSKADPEKE